ncbi:NPCBM/NEW2 domain-containing protein [Micromonospora rhizosphaerae]|nr:NPCBM/NEW2 domain-containing protein [Micromonospora rhizosphaerae]
MGWNDWYTFFCDLDENLIKQTVDAMISTGMRDAGYKYVNLDDCWSAKERDAAGRLQADPAKFPSGIKALADYVHERGMKLGIYGDVGTQTCARYPGSYGHEAVDAQTFADWEVDFVKVDWCFVPFEDFPGKSQQEVAAELYGRWHDAIEATGRPMFFSICVWDPSVKSWEIAGPLGDMWRTSNDYSDSWGAVLGNIDAQAPLADLAGPDKGWNDPDILMVGKGGMTATEYRTQFSMWSMMAAPLLAGNDVRNMSQETLRTLTNTEVIAIDQDPLGRQATRVRDDGDLEVWARPLANGDVAVALLNRSGIAQTITAQASEAGLPTAESYSLRDVWAHQTTKSTGAIRAFVPSHGTAVFRVTQSGDAKAPAVSTSVKIGADAGTEWPVLFPGEPGTVEVVVANDAPMTVTDVRIELVVPDGWDVEGDPVRRERQLGGEREVSVSYAVTPSRDTSGDRTPVTARVTYQYGKNIGSTSGTQLALVVPKPPTGESYLSDLAWLDASSGWQSVTRDREVGGGPINLAGTTYAKGLGLATPGDVTYWVGESCSRLTALAGIDDVVDRVSPAGGTAVFEVYADGEKVFDSGLVRRGAAIPVDVSLTGVSELRLHVADGGDGGYNDRADWADAKVTCA